MMVAFELDTSKPVTLTEEEKEMIRKAAGMPPNYDDDCPELTGDLWEAAKRAAKERNRRRLEREGYKITAIG